MKKVKPQPLDMIAIRLKTRARDNIFDNGADLLEAQSQLDHGHFVDWLEENWDRSIATAYNVMRAAEFAASFPNVRKLKLRAAALYRLSSIEDLDEALRERAFAEAAQDWVSVKRLDEIEDELHPPEDESAEAKRTTSPRPPAPTRRTPRSTRKRPTRPRRSLMVRRRNCRPIRPRSLPRAERKKCSSIRQSVGS